MSMAWRQAEGMGVLNKEADKKQNRHKYMVQRVLGAGEGQEAEGTGNADWLEVVGEGGCSILAPVLREDYEQMT